MQESLALTISSRTNRGEGRGGGNSFSYVKLKKERSAGKQLISKPNYLHRIVLTWILMTL